MKRKLAAILAVLMLCSLSAAATEREDYEDELVQRKSELHMPYCDAGQANVSVDGAYLTTGTFSAPFVTSMGEIALPLRGFFWNAGAKPRVYYRDNRVNTWLPDGSNLEIKNGSRYAVITKDGKTRTVDMEWETRPLYGDNYALSCHVQAMLGCAAAYDKEMDTVHFTDWAKIGAELDEELVCLGEILSCEAEKPVSAGARLMGDYPLQTVATEGIPPVRRMLQESLFTRALLGDNAFTLRESGKSKTYTSQGDAVRLAVWVAAAQRMDDSLRFARGPLDALPERLPDIRYTLTFRTYDGDLRQAELSGSVQPVGGKRETFSVNFMGKSGDLLENILAAMPLGKWMPMLAEFGGGAKN